VRKLTDDIMALRPTIFPAVPRVLERIQSGIQGKVKAAPWPARALIGAAMRWKLARIRAGRPVGKARARSNHAMPAHCQVERVRHVVRARSSAWMRAGSWRAFAPGGLRAKGTADPRGATTQATPVLDWLLFHRFRAGFGGRVRFIVSGGAPLSTGVAEYLAATLCCPVFQARPRPPGPAPALLTSALGARHVLWRADPLSARRLTTAGRAAAAVTGQTGRTLLAHGLHGPCAWDGCCCSQRAARPSVFMNAALLVSSP